MKTKSLSLLAVVVSLFYLACSSENDVVTGDKESAIESHGSNAIAHRIADPDVFVAKGLYSDMMSSTEYADYNSSIDAFNAKLTKVNRYVTFTDKADWLDWIDNNIGTTDFTDKIEFETMLDDMDTKMDDLMKANDDLYDFLLEADEDQIAVIVSPRFDDDYALYIGSVNAQTPCEEICWEAAFDAWDVMETVYNIAQDVINSSYPSVDVIVMFREADRRQSMEMECIVFELNDCIFNC